MCVSTVPADLGEDEGFCYWTINQHIARRYANEEKWDESEDSNSKAIFPWSCDWGEDSMALGSHKATSLQCQQQKICAEMHRLKELLLQLPSSHAAQVPACWGVQAGPWGKDRCSQRQLVLLLRSQQLI